MKILLDEFKFYLKKLMVNEIGYIKELETSEIEEKILYEDKDLHYNNVLNSKLEFEKKLEEIYQKIICEIVKNYKNLFNLLRSSIIVYFFLCLDNLNCIQQLSSSSIRSMFTIKNIRRKLFHAVESNIDFNILEYHPLVIENIDKKDAIIRFLCNKIILALRIDTFNKSKFIDYYKVIEDELNKNKDDETVPIPKVRKNTTRGGIKKRIKKFKKINKRIED